MQEAATEASTNKRRKRAPRSGATAGTTTRRRGTSKKRASSQRDSKTKNTNSQQSTIVSIPVKSLPTNQPNDNFHPTTVPILNTGPSSGIPILNSEGYMDERMDGEENKDIDQQQQQPNKRAKKMVSYLLEVRDMMYTFGDVRNGSSESHTLVEDIVKQYLVNLTHQAIRQAHRRGVIRITINDLVFQIRKDVPKLHRLQEFLGWKEVRKKFGKGDTEDVLTSSPKEIPKKKPITKHKKLLPMCDLLTTFRQIDSDDDETDLESESEIDAQNKERLKHADEITKTMTKEEYMEYTDCRQASFTYKKNKKFREWIGTVLKVKLSDELVEVLGYLAWEMVGSITQQALIVKKDMEEGQYRGLHSKNRTGSIINVKLQSPTFDRDNEKTPVLPVHIREAMRRNQGPKLSLVDFTSVHIYQGGNFTL